MSVEELEELKLLLRRLEDLQKALPTLILLVKGAIASARA